MAFHTPHGSARMRLPWSWSAFDYRTLCEELWAQCDARFEIAKVERRVGDTSSRPIAGSITAPLIVDALGWRRVLGSGPNVQPPEAQISRGLEVHPDARGGDTDLDVWIDRSLIRSGYAWSVPAGGEQRVGVGSYEPRDHVKEPTREIAGRLGVAAGPLPGQLVPARAAAGGRGRRLLRRRQRGPLPPAVGRGDPDGVLLRHRLRARAAAGALRRGHARGGARRVRGVLRGAPAGVRARAAAAAADPRAAAAGPDRAARRRRARAPVPARVHVVPGAGAPAVRDEPGSSNCGIEGGPSMPQLRGYGTTTSFACGEVPWRCQASGTSSRPIRSIRTAISPRAACPASSA